MLKRASLYNKQCLAVVFGLSARKGVYEIGFELCIFSLQLDGGIMLFNVEKLMGIIACIMKLHQLHEGHQVDVSFGQVAYR